MNIEKVIRVLGYLLYTALWMPVIVLAIVITPIVWIAMYIRSGAPVKKCIKNLKDALVSGIKHDMTFIRTGKW